VDWNNGVPVDGGPAPPLTTIRDFIVHGDYDDDFIVEEEEDEDEWDDVTRGMSRLSMEGSDGGDADDENNGGDVDDEVRSNVNGATYRLPASRSRTLRTAWLRRCHGGRRAARCGGITTGASG
jgi:hypothetical protein